MTTALSEAGAAKHAGSANAVATVDFAVMRSANPIEATRCEHREDPYWSNLWDYANGALWTSLKTKQRMFAAGVGRARVGEASYTNERAMLGLATRGPLRHRERLNALAAIGLWRTLTLDQLAAFTGCVDVTAKESVIRDLLLASGLAQEGRLSRGVVGGGSVTLLRPDYLGDMETMSTLLDYTDWVGISGGQRWTWGSQFDRHNLLGTELALRVAEWCDVGAVLGESMANLHLLAPPECKISASTRAADAVIIRQDGLRIAVETTAATTNSLAAKVAKWADILARDTTRMLAVVFVEAAHPDRQQTRYQVKLLEGLRSAIHNAATATIDHQLNDVAERMTMVRWSDWFPEPGKVVADFAAMPAIRPTGPRNDRWQPVDLLNPFDLAAPLDPERAAAAVTNSNLLYGTPHWLRDPAKAIDLDSLVRTDAGVSASPVPISRTRR